VSSASIWLLAAAFVTFTEARPARWRLSGSSGSVAEARAAAAAEPVVLQRREAEEVLIDLLDDVSRILAQIKSELHGNVVSPASLAVAGEWMDRTARVAKVITDGDLATKLHDRIGWMAQDRGSQLTAVLAAVLQHAPLSAQQRLAVWESRFDGVQAIRDGELPLRMLGEATAEFTERLQVAAAVEKAAAEGITWGDPESDSDSDLTPHSSHGAPGSVVWRRNELEDRRDAWGRRRGGVDGARRSRRAQLGTDLTQGPALAVQVGRSHRDTVTAGPDTWRRRGHDRRAACNC
jgi:hypothetical protein